MSEQTETERVAKYLAGFGITATHIETVTEWEFLNAHGGWVPANPSFPEESARNNARHFKTYRVRSREVTYTEWVEQ